MNSSSTAPALPIPGLVTARTYQGAAPLTASEGAHESVAQAVFHSAARAKEMGEQIAASSPVGKSV